jgi:hypothetical protein
VTAREQEEYKALRETIRERGTARIGIFVIGLLGWTGFVIAVLALALPPVAVILPLVWLAAAFEAVLALHVGVERVGRYLLVFHADAWENAAGAFGPVKGAPVVDPLFARFFFLAAVANMIPLLATTPIVQELVLVVGAHLVFGVRIGVARMAVVRQRRVDTVRFEQLRRSKFERRNGEDGENGEALNTETK